ncbi:MAG: hypothetical protein A2Y24_07630 [Clostridiales bacterium GWE2_32_10]|nr:MAG: hypothetical protein A2Y24_07630 [Clostridiales bacterium GWE2_32_10]HBY19746.1 DUF2191 domain-containing protein [Clostridiales bacterium]
MRTNIVLDDELVSEGMRIAKVKTKRELINIALREFIKTKNRKNLMDLKGKIKFTDDYDYKKLREGN